MKNNDILRSLRYTLDLNDELMIKIFALADKSVDRSKVCAWLKQEDDPAFISCENEDMISYLDGLIYLKRGKQERPSSDLDHVLNNNVVLRKIKIALNLKSDDLLSILQLTNTKISKHELSALFRNKDHKHYRECQDQFLRNFLKGLQITYRPTP